MTFVELIINNKPVIVNPRSTILQACETAGIGLSRFCYHENLSVAGNCRMCLVEVQKSPKPVVACAMPVRKGRVIFTDTPLVRKARESVLEFLLVNHPLDCPICDQGGECDLQDETLVYGSDRGRYFEFKRSVENKECGPIVKTIITRCIHCTRCVRFSTEVAGNEIRGRFGRGEESEIGTYVNSFIATELSGNLVDLCPVGALTSKPYAYKVRNWELDQVDTVDFFDAIASNIVVYKAPSEEIVRILPRNDSMYAENWISDRTRYAFDGLKYMSNRTHFATSYKSFWTAEGYDFVRGSQINLERAYAAKVFTSVKPYGSVNQDFISPKLSLDIPFFYSFNRMFTAFADDTRSSVRQIGTNLRFEASLLNTILRREQSRRGLQYVTVGAFAPLRYAHSHKGNSLSTLYCILENRITFVKQQYNSHKSLSILSGVDSLRNDYSTFVQKLIFLVGKLFFAKTASKDRLGFVHSSVGSLSFSHLGITSKMPQTAYTFKVASPIYSKNGQFIPSTITDLNSKYISGLTSKTLYETDGYLISLQGQRRKHVKVINSIVTNNLPKFNFESELCAIWKAEKKKVTERKTFHITNFWYGLQFFRDENPIATYLETNLLSFTFNPFTVYQDSLIEAPILKFAQPVHDFYLQQQIASTSTTIADCSLYQNQESNFTKEI